MVIGYWLWVIDAAASHKLPINPINPIQPINPINHSVTTNLSITNNQ